MFTSSTSLLVGSTILTLILSLLVESSQEQISNLTFNFKPIDNASSRENLLPCPNNPLRIKNKLNNQCLMLKIFNRTELDYMDDLELHNKSLECACQLGDMFELWLEAFDTPDSRRVRKTVENLTNRNNETIHPGYIWSDVEVTVDGVSIYTATKDYFEQSKHNRSLALSPSLRRQLDYDETWLAIKRTCRLVAKDRFKLYRYMENLTRMDPVIFFRLVLSNQAVGQIYQASKACKILMMLHFDQYQIKPQNPRLIIVDQDEIQRQDWSEVVHETDNEIGNDIDLMLKDASVHLLRCNSTISWDTPASIESLEVECPMMMSNQVVEGWLKEYPTALERSKVAIECGCKLLKHNSTWMRMIRDDDVQIMSNSLTDYMNRNRVPNFMNTPIWAIYSWFNDIMSKFTTSRKMSVKEVTKAMAGEQDPTTVINDKSDSYQRALDLMRRACNFIMFSHKKNSKESRELRLIRYLDNLQSITEDRMFVFHLSLQDPNLFKLHALSKMCEPIVRERVSRS